MRVRRNMALGAILRGSVWPVLREEVARFTSGRAVTLSHPLTHWTSKPGNKGRATSASSGTENEPPAWRGSRATNVQRVDQFSYARTPMGPVPPTNHHRHSFPASRRAGLNKEHFQLGIQNPRPQTVPQELAPPPVPDQNPRCRGCYIGGASCPTGHYGLGGGLYRVLVTGFLRSRSPKTER